MQRLSLCFLTLVVKLGHALTLCVGLGRVKNDYQTTNWSAKSFVDLNLALALLLEIFVHAKKI